MAEPGDQISTRVPDSGIQRAGDAAILLANTPHPVTVGLDQVPGVVAGTIIHENDFDIWVGLGKNTLNRFAQVIRAVVDRDHHADEG